MTTVQAKTYGSLDEAIKAGHVWVFNNSADEKVNRKKGILILQVKTSDGSKQTITIPNSWVPIDLTSFVTLDELKTCTNLRQYISRRILLALHPESVEQLKLSPDYDAEMNRVQKTIAGITGNVQGTEFEIRTSGAGIATKADPNKVAGLEISPIVTTVLEAGSSQAIVAKLDQHLHDLTLVDIQQMALRAQSGSFLERLAAELEAYLTEDGKLPIASIEETDTVALAKGDGTFSAPSISF